MSTIFPNIRKLLETQLATTVGVPEIAWENVKFEPTTDTPYVKPTTILTIRRPACVGPNPQQYYQGILILECYTPNNKGPSEVDALVSLLTDRFEATSTISDGTVALQIRTAEHGQGLSDGPWHKTIISISWHTYY